MMFGMLPCFPAATLWDSGWIGVSPASAVGVLVKLVAFLGNLHWPDSGADSGVGGVSCVELLILYELWAGERPAFEKAVPRNRRRGRPISVSAVPFGPGVDIWRSCRFLGGMIRALGILPGGLAGLCRAVLVQTVAVSGTWVGRSVVMV